MAKKQPQQNNNRDVDEDIQSPPAKPWSGTAQAIAAVGWSSFLAACLATMLFFAFIDPALIHEATTLRIEMTRMTGYGIGFFFFWLMCAVASSISVYLLQTAHPSARDPDGDDE